MEKSEVPPVVVRFVSWFLDPNDLLAYFRVFYRNLRDHKLFPPPYPAWKHMVKTVPLLRWALHETEREWFYEDNLSNLIARHGTVEVMEYARAELAVEPTEQDMCAAAGKGQVAMMEWLLEKAGVRLSGNEASSAAIGGHVDTLRWLKDHGVAVRESISVYDVVEADQANVLAWLKETETITDASIATEVQDGIRTLIRGWRSWKSIKWVQAHALRWAIEHCEPFEPFDGCAIVELFVEAGDIELIEWAIDQGFPVNGHSMTVAAIRSKKPAVLKWAKKSGYPLEHGTHHAILERNLDMLKLVVQEGCPWTEGSLPNAVMTGDLEMVEWVMSNGCPLTPEAYKKAMYLSGCVGMLQLLKSRGCPMPKDDCLCRIFFERIENETYDDYEIEDCVSSSDIFWSTFKNLRWVIDNGSRWSREARQKICSDALEFKCLSALKWAYKRGCPLAQDTVDEALEYRGFCADTEEWLLSNDFFVDPPNDLKRTLEEYWVRVRSGVRRVVNEPCTHRLETEDLVWNHQKIQTARWRSRALRRKVLKRKRRRLARTGNARRSHSRTSAARHLLRRFIRSERS